VIRLTGLGRETAIKEGRDKKWLRRAEINSG